MYIKSNQIAFVKQNHLCDETDDCVYGEDQWPKATGGVERRKRASPTTGSPIDFGGICTA